MPPIHISIENGPRASSHTWRSRQQVQAQTAGPAPEPSTPGTWQGMARNMGRSFCKRWKKKKSSGRVQGHLSCFRQEWLEAELCHLHPGSVTLGKLRTPLSLNFTIHRVGLLSRSSKIMCEKIWMSFYYWQLRGGVPGDLQVSHLILPQLKGNSLHCTIISTVLVDPSETEGWRA